MGEPSAVGKFFTVIIDEIKTLLIEKNFHPQKAAFVTRACVMTNAISWSTMMQTKHHNKGYIYSISTNFTSCIFT